jgi:hemerythrin-like metal-binding protein
MEPGFSKEPSMQDTGDLWTESMSVGVEQIDDHHKTLLRLLFETKEAVEKGADRERIKEILSSLISYSKYHFLAEERLMLECKYPRTDDEKADHLWFVEKLDESFLSFSQDTGRISKDLFSFLKDWFIGHILGLDVGIGKYVEGSARKG